MSCERPGLQQALLAEARGGAVHASVYLEHLATCRDCRDALGFLERTRQHDRPELSPDELAALRLRILPRLSWQQAPARRLRPSLALAFAVAASAAVSLAAGSYFVWQGQAPEAPSAPVRRDPAPRSAPEPAPLLPRADGVTEPSRGEPAAAAGAAARQGAAVGKPASAAPKAAASGLWSDAASALKDDDLPRAEQALGQLAGDADGVTRDSAQLALAEIWLKNQQVPRARVVLLRLSRSGATPAIRQRAARLLAEQPR